MWHFWNFVECEKIRGSSQMSRVDVVEVHILSATIFLRLSMQFMVWLFLCCKWILYNCAMDIFWQFCSESTVFRKQPYQQQIFFQVQLWHLYSCSSSTLAWLVLFAHCVNVQAPAFYNMCCKVNRIRLLHYFLAYLFQAQFHELVLFILTQV